MKAYHTVSRIVHVPANSNFAGHEHEIVDRIRSLRANVQATTPWLLKKKGGGFGFRLTYSAKGANSDDIRKITSHVLAHFDSSYAARPYNLVSVI